MKTFEFRVTIVDTPRYRVNLYVNPTQIVDDIFQTARFFYEVEQSILRNILKLFWQFENVLRLEYRSLRLQYQAYQQTAADQGCKKRRDPVSHTALDP